MKKQALTILLLIVFNVGFISSQEAEVVRIAKQFCHSTNNFFYFKTDEKLDEKLTLPLSEIFDYNEAAYFVSTGTKTIMILPSISMDSSLSGAVKYFEETQKYTFAIRGQSRTMFMNEKPIYRFYPYKNTVILEIFGLN